MMRIFLATILVLGLAACGKHAAREISEQAAPAPMAMRASDGMQSGGGTVRKNLVPDTEGAETPQSGRLLALSHWFQFQLPAGNIASTANHVAQTCASAGADKCVLMSSNINQYNDDNINAQLRMRVRPDWFESFAADLKASAKDAKGKLVSSKSNAEDVTMQVSDTTARLKTLNTLRERLQGLLATKDAKVKDLIEVERELARVQGEIETITARLKVLKTRVAMSDVNITYSSRPQAASRSAFAPIVDALRDFLGNVSYGLAAVINFVAFLLPWLLVIVPALWLIRFWWRRRRTGTKNKT